MRRSFFNEMEIHPAENDHEKVIQRLKSKIHEGAQKAKSLSSACIYRVPKELRKLNESAYTPRLIAIGPLHRNDPHLQTPMQQVKMSYMNNLLCRLTKGMEDLELAEHKKLIVLRECMAAMKASLDDAKKSYAEEVMLDEEMMLVDGCFILELLYKLALEGIRLGTEDPIFANISRIVAVQHDLVLLENQIPFLVLERLFPLTLARIPNNPREGFSLTDYVVLPHVEYLMRPVEGQSTNRGSTKTSCSPRDCILWVLANKINNSKPEEKVPSEKKDSREEEVPKPSDFGHILHKLHHDFRPQDQTAGRQGWRGFYLPSASELVYAGVKFVPATGNDLFKVKFTEPGGPFWWFRSACFEIPSIHVQKSTELVLMNFIAFEQCCPGISQHFTSYAYLMDRLMNSDTDVQELENAGVIHSVFGASEAALDIFNKLFKEVILSEFYFADACNRATVYSKRFWPKNMAYLRSQYFASPWKFIAFCLGFVYFGLTIAQLIVRIYFK